MVHKMHRNISSWISKNAHQSQIRFKVSLTARSLKQIFVFSLDVNILCLPWKGNEIRTSHGIERGENLYSNWRTGFGYLWNFWDSWYFYWIFGSIDFFHFFDFLDFTLRIVIVGGRGISEIWIFARHFNLLRPTPNLRF